MAWDWHKKINTPLLPRYTWELNSQYYSTLLEKYVCLLTFAKRDGTIRVMKGTLNHAYIEQTLIAEANRLSQKPSSDMSIVIPVFDIEIKEWRAFNVKRLVAFKTL